MCCIRVQEKGLVLYQGTEEGYCAVSGYRRRVLCCIENEKTCPETEEACTIDGRKDEDSFVLSPILKYLIASLPRLYCAEYMWKAT